MKKTVILFGIASLFFAPGIAYPQAAQLAKPFTGVVNIAVARAIKQRAISAGHAANDPAIALTTTAASNVVQLAVATGSVAATVASVSTAPVWLSAALGLGALYEIYDFSMGQFDVRVEPGATKVNLATGTVVLSTPPPPAASTSELQVPPVQMPFDYSDPGVGVNVAYPNDLPICATVVSQRGGATQSTATYCAAVVQSLKTQSQTLHMRDVIAYYNDATAPRIFVAFALTSFSGPTKTSCTLSPLICPQGTNYAYTENYTATYNNNPSNPSNPNSTQATKLTYTVFNNPAYVDPAKKYSLNDAVAKFTDTDRSTYADPQLLAALANRIWQQAALQPGYQGLPYDALNPITEQDILSDIANGVYPHPTVADFLALTMAAGALAPQLDPDAQPVTSPATESTVNVDFGPDPGMPQPVLEAIPTGASIVSYVMGLLPSTMAFAMPVHASQCSFPTFNFFGGAQSMGSMCDLLEQNRLTLSTIFSALWGIFALAFILRA